MLRIILIATAILAGEKFLFHTYFVLIGCIKSTSFLLIVQTDPILNYCKGVRVRVKGRCRVSVRIRAHMGSLGEKVNRCIPAVAETQQYETCNLQFVDDYTCNKDNLCYYGCHKGYCWSQCNGLSEMIWDGPPGTCHTGCLL